MVIHMKKIDLSSVKSAAERSTRGEKKRTKWKEDKINANKLKKRRRNG